MKIENNKEAELQKALDKSHKKIIELTLSSSKTITENTILPDLISKKISSQFKVQEKNGELIVIPIDKDGGQRFSFHRPGEHAEAEEVIQELIKRPDLQMYLLPEDLKQGPSSAPESKPLPKAEALIEKYREAVTNRRAGDMMTYFEELNKMGVRIPQQ